MGIDAVIGLVVDRPHCQILLQVLKGLLNFGELDVIFPQDRRVPVNQIGTKQITSLSASDSSQLFLSNRNVKVFGLTGSFGPEKGVIGSRSLPDLISFTPLDKTLFGFAV